MLSMKGLNPRSHSRKRGAARSPVALLAVILLLIASCFVSLTRAGLEPGKWHSLIDTNSVETATPLERLHAYTIYRDSVCNADLMWMAAPLSDASISS